MLTVRARPDHPLDHPDDPTGPVWNRPDRRGIQREQARSVWSRPDRRRAPGYGSGGAAGQPRRRRCLALRRCLVCLPPGCGRSPRNRYSRPRIGRSTAAVAAETDAAWSPGRIGCPVVVVAGSVVVVVGSVVVVVGSVIVVVGSTVVVGAVTVGWVVVAPNVTGPVVVVRPTVAGAPVVTGRVVVVGPLAASGVVSALVVDGAREVLGWRGRVVVVDAAVGAGSAGTVDSAPGWPGVGGGGSWGPRAAEATKAPRTEAVSPKANSVSRQGCRGGSRCRGDRLGIGAVVPVRLVLPLLGCRPSAPYRPPRTWPRTIDRTARSCQSSGRGQCSRAAAEDGGTQASRGTRCDPGDGLVDVDARAVLAR
jgi:hypothetical protein